MQQLYLDHAATTPVDPAVVDAMLPFWTEQWGNPSSVHQTGQRAAAALDSARQRIAQQIGARAKEIVLTGCGSESDNLALRGVMLAAQAHGKNHLITSPIEHKAILSTAKQLRDQFGIELTLLPVDEYGRVRVEDVAAAIRPNTALISIMAANNEIGTLNPIDDIGRLARERGVLFHTDAVQQIAFQRWNMADMPIDLMSLAAHKFYGPKGVGALYVRDGITLLPSMTGGSQEAGRRPGTSNVAFAAGMATALELVQARREQAVPHYTAMRDHFVARVLAGGGDRIRLTGHPTERLCNHASFAVRQGDGNSLLMHLDMAGVAASSGSACLVGNPEPSKVLEALGLGAEWTQGGLRFSFGRKNDPAHANQAADTLITILDRLL